MTIAIILQGRDPRDAIDISSRACGVCGGVHSTVSSMAIEQAFGIVPPPLGVVVRNLGEVAEMFYDHPIHLGLLAGPDYSTALVSMSEQGVDTDQFQAAMGPALAAFIDGSSAWLDVERRNGPDGAADTWAEVLSGRVAPSVGRITSLHAE